MQLTPSALPGRVLQTKCFNEGSLSAILMTVSACLLSASPDSSRLFPVKRCSQKLVTKKMASTSYATCQYLPPCKRTIAQRAYLVGLGKGRLIIEVGRHDLRTGREESLGGRAGRVASDSADFPV